MSFNTGLSGLNAANTDMSVIGNNIANVGTIGFKTSRAEFADMYLTSKIGSGAYCSNIYQQMNGGNISGTGRDLDLAIDGQGYFVLNNNGETFYSRAGAFYTDNKGNIINSNGDKLQGYSIDGNGNIAYGNLTDLQVTSASVKAKSTSKIGFAVSLDSNAKVIEKTVKGENDIEKETFDPQNPDTFNWSTNTTIFDSQGNKHNLTNYFVKRANNQWEMYSLVDGRNPGNPANADMPKPQVIEFDSKGELKSAKVIDLGKWIPAIKNGENWQSNGTEEGNLSIDLTGSLQINSEFGINSAGIKQDGYASGLLTKINIDADGKLFANFSNGQSRVVGQLALATFANEQGLDALSGNKWRATYAAGNPAVGVPNTGLAGKISAGALEDSNVDLTAQLVKMIVAQRNYQANAKTIETESTLAQTIINLR